VGMGPLTATEAPGTTRTVLIVDDNAALLEFVTDTLHELGDYVVLTAADGVEGLRSCAQSQPACVVADVRMPRVDGLQFVRALRGDPATAQIPVVMLSALVQGRDQMVGLLAGADQYLLKPVTPLDLVAAIERAIRLGEAERAERLLRLADGGAPAAVEAPGATDDADIASENVGAPPRGGTPPRR
jgi:CheY-like chemotaxis protein